MLPSLADQNPLVWMAEVNGVLVDLRDMPRELQVIGHNQLSKIILGVRPTVKWTQTG